MRLPLLEEAFGHGVADGLARSADLLREDDAALDALAAEAAAAARAGRGLAVARLTALPAAIARRVVHRWLLARGGAAAATFDAVRRVLANLDGKSGRWQFTAGGGLRVCRRGAALAAARPAASPVRTGQQQPGEKSRFLRRDGTVSIGGLRVTVRRARGIARESGPVGRLPAQCTIHAGAVRGKRLAVRFRKPGDRIAPIGLSGSRKVQDVLTDAKLPAEQRDTIPLLVCGGEVVWIPGYRVAARYAVPGPDAPSLRVTIRRALTPRIRPSRASPPRR